MKGLASSKKIHKELIVRLLDIAGVLTIEQLMRFTRLDKSVLSTVLTQLQRENRLIRSENMVASTIQKLENKRDGVIEAMWVFTDFFPRVEYYTKGEYPAVVCFFADGAEYEIIYVPQGQEHIINKAISSGDAPPKRLAVIESIGQISNISIPNITAYCIIEPGGKTNYYKRKEK